MNPKNDAPVPGNSITCLLFGMPIVIAVLSMLAARWFGWSLGWLYVGNFTVTHMFGLLCVRIWNPVLLARRGRLGSNTKRWDIVILIALTAGLVAAIFVANIDLKSDSQPDLTWLIAAMFFSLGYGLTLWCSVVNPFLEKTVRIQADNEQRVVDTGPYAFVRHPMYVGVIAILLATPVMLDSSWTYLPMIWCIAVLVIRTAWEDQTLQAELDGYADYARRIRFRLIPGVW